MYEYDIVILTEERYLKPKVKDWYINQVLLEDSILQNALEKYDLKVCRKNWADKQFDFSRCRYAIFRTTWDYFDRFNEFFSWIEETKKQTTFINSVDIINWNIDKHYLKELGDKKINIASTEYIERNTEISLIELLSKNNFKKAIIKPAISGAARDTYLIDKNNYKKYEERFQKLIKNKCMLFQEYLFNIEKGEISLIMIGEEYTHAVKKTAKEGDFRVQDDHGGKVERYQPNKNEINFAKNCLNAIPFSPMYSRVDIVYDNNNNPSLTEIELIEPELWFRNNPAAASKLANQINHLIKKKSYVNSSFKKSNNKNFTC